jgi:hypothetical protein
MNSVKRADDPWMQPVVSRVRVKFGSESGFTLIELIVTMGLLLLVFTTITDAFISGTHAETNADTRIQVQTDARLALSRMRDDLHCAIAAPAVQANTAGGYSLALTEIPSQCKTVGASSATPWIEWCTVPIGSTGTYALYRNVVPGQTTNCDPNHASFELTDIMSPTDGWPTNTQAGCAANCNGNLWPDPRGCPTGHNFLTTRGVQIAVNPDPTVSPSQLYELDDNIALRNSSPCGYTADSLIQFAWWPTSKVVNNAVNPNEIPIDISGASNPTGSITVTAYTSSDCSTGAHAVGTVSTVNGNGLYYISSSWTPTTTGTYHWQAAYSGDTNNRAETSVCSPATAVTPVPVTPTMVNSAPSPSPATTATSIMLTATFTSGAGPTGTVTFYYDTTGSATCGSSGSWQLAGTGTVSGTTASAMFLPASAGSYRFYAHYGGDPSFNSTDACPAVSDTVTAAPDTFGISSVGPQTAGSAFTTVQLVAQKPGGGTDTAYTGTKTIAFSGPSNAPSGTAPAYPATVVFANGISQSFSVTLYKAQSTTLTASDASGPTGAITGTSSSFLVSAGATAKFSLTNPGSQTAGSAFNVTVTALDAWQNPNSDSTSHTVAWAGALNAPNGVTPTYASTTLNFLAGTASATGFNFKNAASTTLTATQGSITGSSTFTVNGGGVNSISMTNPGVQTAGTAFSVGLTLLDQYQNTANDSTTHTVSWTGASNSPNGDVPAYGATSVAFSNGTATVSGFNFKKAVSTTLKITDGPRTDQKTFTVSTANVVLSWTCPPSQPKKNKTFTETVSRAATDPYGNADPNKASALVIQFSGNNGEGLPANMTIAGGSASNTSGNFSNPNTSGLSITIGAAGTTSGYAPASCTFVTT